MTASLTAWARAQGATPRGPTLRQAAALRVIPESPLSEEVALHYTSMYKERVKPTELSPGPASEAGSGEAAGSDGSDGEGDPSGGGGGRRAGLTLTTLTLTLALTLTVTVTLTLTRRGQPER